MSTPVKIDKLVHSFGSTKAVDELSFEVSEGELFGLIGPDGAGKTTTLRSLCGLIGRDSGTISILGIDPQLHPRKVREFIGYMPQRFSLYPDLSVSENLRFFADLYLVSSEEYLKREARLMQFSKLGPFRNRRAGQLSGGMKQKLALSCTLIHTPKLLILDEPTTGVDPVSRKEFWTILKELSSQGITLVVSTPYMDEALLCDRTILMHSGKILASGTPSEITSHYRFVLIEAFADDLVKLKKLLEENGIEASRIHRFGDRLHISCLNREEASQVIATVNSSGGKASEGSPSIEDTFVSMVGYHGTPTGERP